MPKKPLALYIHVPFCTKMCPYCAFYKKHWDKDLESLYLEAIEREAVYYSKKERLSVGSLFLGGGTPSALSSEGFSRLSRCLDTHFEFTSDCEKTIEMNPETVTEEKLALLKQFLFNRISIGVQSFVPEELQFLGRVHSPKTIETALDLIQQSGFSNFNIDLMFGLSKSSIGSVEASLDRALSFGPTHLSTYALSIEEGTPFHRRKVQKLDSDRELDQYRAIRNRLKGHGFEHYEVSAFSKPGFESRHNLSYWTLSPYIGLGPSACSFYEDVYYQNPSDLDAYVAHPVPPIFDPEQALSSKPEEILKDYILTNLRLLKGFSVEEVDFRFGIDFANQFREIIENLQSEKLLHNHTNRIQVTSKGLEILDEIILRFF